MGRFINNQDTFTSGELSEYIQGRVGVDQYKQGLAECLNFIPQKGGAVIRRPGSKYDITLSHSLAKDIQIKYVDVTDAQIDTGTNILTTTLVTNDPFTFSTGLRVQVSTFGTLPAPLASLTDYYIIKLSSTTFKLATSLANALLGTAIDITTVGVGGFRFIAQDGESITDVKLIPYKVSNDDQFIVAILKLQTKIRFQYYSVISGALLEDEYGLGISYTTEEYLPYATDIQKFQFSQTGSLLVLTHDSGTIPPLFISRTLFSGLIYWAKNFLFPVAPASGTTLDATGNSNLSTYSYTTSLLYAGFIATSNHGLAGNAPFQLQAYEDLNSSQVTMLSSAATVGNITLTSSSAYFKPEMVGAYIKVTPSTVTGLGIITKYNSATSVNVTTFIGITVAATKLWEISSWNSSFGFPRVNSFFEQRLILGSTIKSPDTFWGTMTANFSHFMAKRLAQDLTSDGSGTNYFTTTAGAVVTSDPFNFKVASNEINKIQWALATRTLYMGSIGIEYSISGANSALSATSFQISPESNIGSSYVQPIAIDGSVVHVSRDGKSLRQLKYAFSNGSVISKDLSVLGEKIESSLITNFKEASIKIIALNKTKGLVLVLVSNSTESCLVTVAVDETLNVLGWSKHQLAGTNYVTSICSLQNSTSLQEEFFVSVKRTISGNTVFTLEIIGSNFEGSTTVDYLGSSASLATTGYYLAPIYLDCAYIYDSTPATVFTHPILKSVAVEYLRDGVYDTGTLDASGQITLPSTSKLILGLPFTSRIKLLPPNLGAFGNNDALPSLKKLDKFWIRYLRTKHLLFGTNSSNLLNLEIDPVSALTSTTLYSDTKSKAINHSSEFLPQIIVQTDKPFPVTILQIGYRGVTEEI